MHQTITVDANEAVARVAHALNEVIAIYPITPASPMGEWADAWSMAHKKNIWEDIPEVIEMQSEGGLQVRFTVLFRQELSPQRLRHRRDCY